MKMQGTVRNVVDFGAFIDLGVKYDGLIHISKMCEGKFVKDPFLYVSGNAQNITNKLSKK